MASVPRSRDLDPRFTIRRQLGPQGLDRGTQNSLNRVPVEEDRDSSSIAHQNAQKDVGSPSRNKPSDPCLEEREVLESLLEWGHKLLFILLPIDKARLFEAAVADKDRVTLYDINVKFSLVKWAATFEEFEKVDTLIPIIVKRRNHGMIVQACDIQSVSLDSALEPDAGGDPEGAKDGSCYAVEYSTDIKSSPADSLARPLGRYHVNRPAMERLTVVKSCSTNTPANSQHSLVGTLSMLTNDEVPVYMIPVSAFLGGLAVWAFLSYNVSDILRLVQLLLSTVKLSLCWALTVAATIISYITSTTVIVVPWTMLFILRATRVVLGLVLSGIGTLHDIIAILVKH